MGADSGDVASTEGCKVVSCGVVSRERKYITVRLLGSGAVVVGLSKNKVRCEKEHSRKVS